MGCRDHVFFFSYVQPKQEGGVGGMWSDADALAEVNGMSAFHFPVERVLCC